VHRLLPTLLLLGALGTAQESDWSLRPPERPPAPQVRDAAWVRNPIDAFVLARIEDAGLAPASPAARIALLRRASYDLLGLPPRPEEIAEYVADTAPDAWERQVDRLLASSHYGEKQARHWLDLVRYAETNGYERDSDKEHIWRYRDWVIDSFNADKPYDRFVLEQLAGDELDEVTPETIVATGYQRLMIWDDEPGMGALQARYDVLDDLVSTTAQALLGMTLGCARCHDHKKDPIPQADYYRFMAFFHGLTDMSKDRIFTDIMSVEERAEYERQVAAKERDQAEVLAAIARFENDFLRKLQTHDASAQASTSDLADLRWRFYRDTWERLPEFDALLPEASGTSDNRLFDLAPASRDDAIGLVFEGKLLVPEDGEYEFRLDVHGGARLAVDGAIVVDRDGLHESGQTASGRCVLRQGAVPIRLDYFNRTGKPVLRVEWVDAGGERRRALSADHGAEVRVAELIHERGREVLDETQSQAWRALQRQHREVRERAIPRKQAAAAQESGPSPAVLHVHRRGNASSPGEAVEPAFPACLNPPPAVIPPPPPGAQSSGRRRALAEWIASPTNPRTARVLANRLWQQHFGRGIVRTANDFGGLGSGATHPQLLDWLACELIARGWSQKALHRLIMTSSTYRMSSQADERARSEDPTNDLFTRVELRRLSAEELRDSILVLTGQLNRQLGGPSIFVPMPKEALATSSRPDEVWGTSPREQTFRRSVYIKVKRSLITPILQSFDFPDTDTSCPERFTTTLPTQALAMLNSEFAQRHAADFAARLAAEAGDEPRAQIRLALRLATCREPRADEIESCARFLDGLRAEPEATAESALRTFCLMVLSLNEFAYVE
jgi:hypothetical protein